MKSVRRENTSAELRVRRFLHAQGLRFVLHPAGLPGRPDLVFPKRKTALFVHGCFWHAHDCSHGSVRAKTNAEYWAAKLADNQARDRRQRLELIKLGWQVETIWECESADARKLSTLARRLLRR